jgi:hypothetical protein
MPSRERNPPVRKAKLRRKLSGSRHRAEMSGWGCLEGTAERIVFEDAQQRCQELEWAGQIDWRLPSLQELGSVVDLQPYPGQIRLDPHAFAQLIGINRRLTWTTTESGMDLRLVDPLMTRPVGLDDEIFWTCLRDL